MTNKSVMTFLFLSIKYLSVCLSDSLADRVLTHKTCNTCNTVASRVLTHNTCRDLAIGRLKQET